MAEPPPYIQVPPYAIPIRPKDVLNTTSVATETSSTPPPPLAPPTNARFNLSSMLLTQALASLPTPPPTDGKNGVLISTRDPISIPLMSANFRRFIGKCGFVFWIQDRVEEVMMWRKGNAYTGAWMAAYVFFCYFPRLTLMIPHVVLLHILFTTYQARYPDITTSSPSSSSGKAAAADISPVAQPPEGTPDWFANMQAIQNLMGMVSDVYDAISPHFVHLTWTTSTTQPLFLVTLLSLFSLIPLIYLIPARIIFLTIGLAPFTVTHPYTLSVLPSIIKLLSPYAKAFLQRLLDDDKLREEHWSSRLVTVSVSQNQRWIPPTAPNTDGWSTANLREGKKERKAWTVVEGGWLVKDELDGVPQDVRDLKFPLPSGWKFVGTEEWTIDPLGHGQGAIPGEDGWIYTNDGWLDPQVQPFEEWKAVGVGLTRSRVWTRRVYWAKPSL